MYCQVSLLQLPVVKLLKINGFVIYDTDTDCKEIHQNDHKRDNKKLLIIQGHNAEDEFQAANIVKPNLWAWKTNLGKEVKSEIQNWNAFYTISCAEFGNAADLHKNPLVVARTLELAWEKEETSPNLIKLIETIIEFGTVK